MRSTWALCFVSIAKGATIDCTNLLQYGEPCSGSTFQYWLLQSISALNFAMRWQKQKAPKYQPTVCVPVGQSAKGHMFDLNNNELRQLHVHMKYWSILRRCCGSQLTIEIKCTTSITCTTLLKPMISWSVICTIFRKSSFISHVHLQIA